MTDEPLLLTPGPLTTSMTVKQAMLRDWGSRDSTFIELSARVCRGLENIAGVDAEKPSHICVPIQGSGTFVVEATIDSLIPRDGKVLILINGAYGTRIAKICAIHDREYVVLETDENTPPTYKQIMEKLAADLEISHVVAVHCETTSGILNPIEDIAKAVREAGRFLIIDAMSSFGALPLNVNEIACAAIVASSNKCLEGVPGIGFAIIEQSVLAAAKGNATSLSLDLYDQWQNFEKTRQWRFTPPTHVLAALDQALVEHTAEGGAKGRYQRYQENCDTLIEGMTALGFSTYLSHNLQAPIIVTFHIPQDEKFEFDVFYDKLHGRGFAIYPGKLTKAESFRIGCIGHLDKEDMANVIEAVATVVDEMGVKLA